MYLVKLLTILVFLFISLFSFGQLSDFNSDFIKKNKIKKIEKWYQLKDSLGKDKSWAPFIYEFNKNGQLSKYSCYLCTFTSHTTNLQTDMYKYDNKGRLITRTSKTTTSYFYYYNYPKYNERIEQGFTSNSKKNKELFYTKNSELDSFDREIVSVELYLLSDQKNKNEYFYNLNRDLIQRNYYFKMGNVETKKYSYEYNSSLLKTKEYYIFPDGQKRLLKEYVYNDENFLIQEIIFDQNNNATYNYKYYFYK